MSDRIEVVDPASGATFSVSVDSVQAKLWPTPSKPEPKQEPVKRKPGRPKKS